MHFELVVPGLLAAAPMPRLPSLELLAARGRARRGGPRPLARWLAEGFGLGEGALPAGALTLLGLGRAPGEGFWLRADPAHLEVGNDGVTLTPGERLGVTAQDAGALAAALNEHFGRDCEWIAVRPACWCLRVAEPLAVAAQVPAESWDGDPQPLAQGPGARRAQALLTEVQMLLHGHAVNRERSQCGLPAVNTVCLWGAGELPPRLRARWHTALADDPLVAGLAQLARIGHAGLPRGLAPWLEQAPADGRWLCVLEPLFRAAAPARELEELETRWFAPLLAALRSERIGMLTLHDPEAGARWEITRGDLRRFWRRARSLAATA